MKFSCEKELLNEGISKALRAVSTKSTILALEGILFEADTHVTLTGFDLEIGVQTNVEADVLEKGSIILNARLIADIVRKLPDDIITIESNDQFLTTISCGASIFNLLGINPSDFPELPTVTRERGTILPQNVLKSMIQGTIFSVADNENKPIITGCLFKITEETLTVVALDNYRMAIRRTDVTRAETTEQMTFVVPGKTLREVERFLEEDEQPVNLSLSRRHITFEMGNTILTSRLLEGEFLNYENAIPKTTATKLKVKTDDFITSLDRVSLMINEKLKNYVKCSFTHDLLKLDCTTALGKAYDECPIQITEGEGLEIGFNSRYLLEALRACKEQEVQCALNTPLTPCVITPLEGDDFLYLILPVRLKTNES